MLGIPGSHVVTSLNGNYLINPTAIERKLWRLSHSILNHIHLRLALFHLNYAQKTPYSLLTDTASCVSYDTNMANAFQTPVHGIYVGSYRPIRERDGVRTITHVLT